MDSREREDPHRALGGERVVRVRGRMRPVYLVLDLGTRRKEAARILRKRPRRVRTWPRRCREGGLGALPDRPRSGRPTPAPLAALRGAMRKISRKFVTPERARPVLADASGAACHIATVRRLMRGAGLSPKVARLVRADRAGRRAAAAWQGRLKRRLARLRRRGFTVLVQDEAIFVHDAVAGARYWSPVGVRAGAEYTGSHDRAVACGALAEGGRRLFRTREKFNAATLVPCLGGPRRKFGKVAAVVDRAPQHGARAVRAFLRACGGDIRLIRLPVGSPQPSAAGEACRRAKRELLNPGHHATADGFRLAIGDHFRGARWRLDIHAYLARSPAAWGARGAHRGKVVRAWPRPTCSVRLPTKVVTPEVGIRPSPQASRALSCARASRKAAQTFARRYRRAAP